MLHPATFCRGDLHALKPYYRESLSSIVSNYFRLVAYFCVTLHFLHNKTALNLLVLRVWKGLVP
jgi:hypothetical protein